MNTPQEYGLVRIVRVESDRPVTGTAGVVRPPRVGDIGAVVHVYSDTAFAVECVDADGYTVWLADFELDEIEPVSQR